jgi:hydrogenase maturation protein HypF
VLVNGVVQGVGYRPFVYRLALEEGLAGFVGNDTGGVTIEIEGPGERVEAFLVRLRSEAPPLARIDSVAVRALTPLGAKRDFALRPARSGAGRAPEFLPMRRPARIACGSCSIPRTAATAIRF